MNNGFVDLRRGHLSSESFWPSFTDIMMVVVMIFLLTSMVLVVRNWKLLDQLRHSMAAEEQASRIIHDTSAENSTLEEQLTQAQTDISLLRMQLLQANEQHTKLEKTLEDKEKQVITVLNNNTQLKKNLSKNETRIAGLNTKIATLNNNLSQLSTNLEQKQNLLEETNNKLLIISQQHEDDSRKLTDLEENYGSLKVKYDKLIRPARTAKGKYVVSVNFERIHGKKRIRFKGNQDSEYRIISRRRLNSILARLKKKHPGKLYIKIVIPQKSGLTYNEAWAFMQNLLDKYDYYSQTQPEP